MSETDVDAGDSQNKGISNEELNDQTIIKVVGVGGAGGNAINRMIEDQLKNVEFIAINTDAKDLMRSNADIKISLSDKTSRGLGAGADPAKGEKAAKDHESDIEESLKGADMVFVTCGEGGGTGTGASPLVAHIARSLGALTIAVVTRPFSFEGPRRAEAAVHGIEALRKEVDALIVIPNDRLLQLADQNISIFDAFRTADGALMSGVQGVTDLISAQSYIHVDFNDVTTILKGAGTALFGIGQARGEDRATHAAEIAISSPLLEESIDGAQGVLVNVAGAKNLTLQEANDAVSLIRKSISPQAQIIWGLTLDDSYGDDMRVTVIAAGFDHQKDKNDSAKQSESDNLIDTSDQQRSAQSQQSTADPFADSAAEITHSPEVPSISPIHLDSDHSADQGDQAAASQSSSQAPAGQESSVRQAEPTQSHSASGSEQRNTQETSHDDSGEEDSTGDIDIPPFLRQE